MKYFKILTAALLLGGLFIFNFTKDSALANDDLSLSTFALEQSDALAIGWGPTNSYNCMKWGTHPLTGVYGYWSGYWAHCGGTNWWPCFDYSCTIDIYSSPGDGPGGYARETVDKSNKKAVRINTDQ